MTFLSKLHGSGDGIVQEVIVAAAAYSPSGEEWYVEIDAVVDLEGKSVSPSFDQLGELEMEAASLFKREQLRKANT